MALMRVMTPNASCDLMRGRSNPQILCVYLGDSFVIGSGSNAVTSQISKCAQHQPLHVGARGNRLTIVHVPCSSSFKRVTLAALLKDRPSSHVPQCSRTSSICHLALLCEQTALRAHGHRPQPGRRRLSEYRIPRRNAPLVRRVTDQPLADPFAQQRLQTRRVRGTLRQLRVQTRTRQHCCEAVTVSPRGCETWASLSLHG